MDVDRTIRNVLAKNPEMLLVLEIATRAREVESREPPRELGLSTDIAVVQPNSQGLVPLATLG